MSLRINTNVSSFALQSALDKSQRAINKSMKSLSSGSRLTDASSDAAGAAISSQLQSEIAGLGAARRNAEQGNSFAAVAEGAMAEQTNMIVRMRELAVQAASDTYKDQERAYIQNEFENLQAEVERIAQSTAFGSRKLLDGSLNKIDIQVGNTGGASSRISFSGETSTTLDSLGIESLKVGDKDDARDALDSIDTALNQVATQRSLYGSFQSRLDSAQNSISSSIENLSAAKSQISDADIAKEASDLRLAQVLQQYQAALMQQSNDQAGIALRLIA